MSGPVKPKCYDRKLTDLFGGGKKKEEDVTKQFVDGVIKFLQEYASKERFLEEDME